MEPISKYEKLYGESSERPGAEYLFSELLETRSQAFEWSIKPHIHPRINQLFYVEKGSFTFYDAKSKVNLEGPILIFIPSAILHGFDFDSVTRGRILSISNSMVDALFKESAFLIPILGNLQIIKGGTELSLFNDVKRLMETIDGELNNLYPGKNSMLQAILSQLFIYIYRIWKDYQVAVSGSDHKSLIYFRKFQQLIYQRGTTKTIAQLAGELAITRVHLNRICNQIANKPAGLLVQEHVVDEARKYLMYTSYPISEIAYLLNFEYPNYFARFFKKHTGLTPKEYREMGSV